MLKVQEVLLPLDYVAWLAYKVPQVRKVQEVLPPLDYVVWLVLRVLSVSKETRVRLVA